MNEINKMKENLWAEIFKMITRGREVGHQLPKQ